MDKVIFFLQLAERIIGSALYIKAFSHLKTWRL